MAPGARQLDMGPARIARLALFVLRYDRRMVARILVLACAIVVLPMSASAQTPVVAPQTTPPPDEIAAPVRAALAPGGATVTVGDKTLEFWWVTGVPLTGDDASWAHVAEGTLVGAVRLSAPYTDIRGRGLKAGVYLLRYALQPQNGDHLGASPFREFLLLTPAATDTTPNPGGHDGTVEQAKKAGTSSHPAAWSLDPPAATEPPLQVLTNSDGHRSIVFELPATTHGRSAGTLKFGVIVVGKIEA